MPTIKRYPTSTINRWRVTLLSRYIVLVDSNILSHLWIILRTRFSRDEGFTSDTTPQTVRRRRVTVVQGGAVTSAKDTFSKLKNKKTQALYGAMLKGSFAFL
jgi:hypothetical protein